MANDNILRLRVDSKEYDSKIDRARQGLLHLEQSLQKTGQNFSQANKEQVDFVRELGSMGTVASTAKGKLAELTKAYTDLAVQYKKLTDEEKASPFGQAMSKSLGDLRSRIMEGKSQLDEVNKSLGNTKVESQSTGNVLEQLAGKFGMNVKQLSGWGLALGAATGALKVAKDAFGSSERNIDEWGRTLKGAEGAYDLFLQTLNGGDWSNFFQNLSEAVRGSRDLYDAFDRLGSVKANNAPAIAILEQKLSQLRLLQQSGQDVSKEIEKTTKSLSALKGMSVEAGKNAGTTGAATVLRNALNGSGGRDISNRTIDTVVKDLMYNGQKAVDKYAANYAALQKKGTAKVWAGMDELGNAFYTTAFNIKKLNEQERRQYLISRAVTERETALAPYKGVYAQAVSEETSTNRQEYKYNRYALQGARGGKGGGGGGKGDTYVPLEGSIDAQTAKVQELQKAWRAAADDDSRRKIKKEIEEAEFSLDILTGKTSGIPKMNYGVGDLAGNGGIGQGFEAAAYDKKNPWKLDDKAMTALGKEIARVNEKREASLTKEVGNIANGISGIMGGLESLGIELPQGMKDVVNGIQGVVSILTGIASVVSAIHTLQMAGIIKFAGGGVVRAASGVVAGNTYSGDQIPAMLNAGEVVLNRAQASNLASILQDGERRGGTQVARVSGEQIYIAMNNYLRRSGRGELVTWK